MSTTLYSKAVGDGWDVMIQSAGRNHVLHFHGRTTPPTDDNLAITIQQFEDGLLDQQLDTAGLETETPAEEGF